METTEFYKWLSRAVVVWQGEPGNPEWEVTDGDNSVIVNVADGYRVVHSDFILTKEDVEVVFDVVEMEELERKNQITNPRDIIDDWEHGLYGYGY